MSHFLQAMLGSSTFSSSARWSQVRHAITTYMYLIFMHKCVIQVFVAEPQKELYTSENFAKGMPFCLGSKLFGIVSKEDTEHW